MVMRRAALWSRRIATSRWGDLGLAFASFAETVIVPIPLELVLIPHMQANRERLWWLATVALLGCLAGALLGYGVGYLLFESIGDWALDRFGWREDFELFRQWFDRYGFWAIVAIGIVPVPFQTAMLLAGLTEYSVALFVLAALLARGIRYYGLAGLVHVLGWRAESLYRRHRKTFALVASLVVAAIVGGSWLLGGFLQEGAGANSSTVRRTVPTLVRVATARSAPEVPDRASRSRESVQRSGS